jgi:hypothetical protein
VVTGTPLFLDVQGVAWGGLFAEILVSVVLLHQLATGIGDLAPAGDSDERRWGKGIRVGALVAGAVKLVGLVGYATPLGLLYPLGVLALVIVGIVAVVLLHRVNRAGWLGTARPAGSAAAVDPPAPA